MIKIGEFARVFEISIKTIRFYEEKGLINPCYIDNYTGYRYFDKTNIEEMTKILILKDLGLSLKEIKNFKFNEQDIKNKIQNYEKKVNEIQNNIHILTNLLHKKEDITKMKIFQNDELAIGKWELIGISKTLEEAYKKSYIEDYFNIKEIHLLPNGEEYWVIKWTKGFIYIKDNECPYEIKENNMYIKINDPNNLTSYNIATYKKINNKEYTIDEIRIKDNIDIPFIEDKKIIGNWKTIDFIKNKETFNPKERYYKDKLFLDKIIITNDNDCIRTFNKQTGKDTKNIKYTKGYIINLCCSNTKSKYEIIDKNNKQYLIVEWKSGDYIYGNMINGYYVLENITQNRVEKTFH